MISLGKLLRTSRLELGIGLRELAMRVGISPTYLSRIETNDEKSPPSEVVLMALAQEIQIDPDRLIMIAGRVPADVVAILTTQHGWAGFIRRAAELKVTPEDLKRLLRAACEP